MAVFGGGVGINSLLRDQQFGLMPPSNKLLSYRDTREEVATGAAAGDKNFEG